MGRPQPRLYQYSLRSLLIFVLVANVGMAWFGARWRAARQQRLAVAAIRALGGRAIYDYEDRAWRSGSATVDAPGPVWARRLLGVDFFAKVVGLARPAGSVMGGPRSVPITDAWLEQIGQLTGIEKLNLRESQISDAGLVRLAGLVGLRELDLTGTEITDAGIKHIGNLTHIEVLKLRFTRLTDAGLEHLTGFGALRRLDLGNTGVTAEGVRKLRRALPKCEITSNFPPAAGGQATKNGNH